MVPQVEIVCQPGINAQGQRRMQQGQRQVENRVIGDLDAGDRREDDRRVAEDHREDASQGAAGHGRLCGERTGLWRHQACRDSESADADGRRREGGEDR